ncbi:MAG: cyanophycin synthetase [Acidimicrobiia bacterium]
MSDAKDRGKSEERPLPAPELRILESQVYQGPNFWSYRPCIRLLVDLGVLEEHPSNTLEGFNEKLVKLLPGLEDHTCSLERRGGFLERLEDGTWLGHVAEHVAIELQRQTGAQGRRGKTRSADQPGRYHVVYGFQDETVGLAAGKLAVRLVNHLVEPEDGFDFEEELTQLILTAERVAFGPSTQAIIDEAVSRDIPYFRLDRQSLVQLGHGVYQKRIRATLTSSTSWLAVDISSDKKLTTRLLSEAGLPVPRSRSVRGEEDAVAVARSIGFPVVVKPADGNHGRGVSLDLRNEEGVRAAFEGARRESQSGWVVVENQVEGNDYRVLVVEGNMVAVAQRLPAHVTGDGRHTVAELVDEMNSDPRRGIGHEKVLTRIQVTPAAIELVRWQGFEMGDVPPEGTTVKLTLTGNLSTGGTSIDRTAEAHPENVELAEEAARVVGLDVAGVDLICPDIGKPVRETGGAIVEVNAGPGFRMHTHPTEGIQQYVAKPLVDLLFPPGTPSRIPIVAVTGTNGKTTTVRMIAHILKGTGRKVGMTSTDGVTIDERVVIRADASGPRSARMVLQSPRVDFAVFEVARGGLLREGLGYQRHDVGVVLNLASDHLGRHGIDSLEKLGAVKQIVVEAIPRDGFAVLNADDPLVAKMRRVSAGEVIWFSMDPDNELVDAYVRRDGWAVTVQQTDKGEMIVIRHGPRTMPLALTHQLPSTFGARARMNVENALAATAAAHAAGVHLHDIRRGLVTFTPSYALAPGRLNLIRVRGVTVVVDYAHNPHGLRMLGDFVERMAETQPGEEVIVQRRLGVIAMPGDRRDEDLREFGEVAARHFDLVLVREDANLRGRPAGESAEVVAEGVRKGMQDPTARCRSLAIVPDELEAVGAALGRANRGDLVVICVDRLDPVWEFLQQQAGRVPTALEA